MAWTPCLTFERSGVVVPDAEALRLQGAGAADCEVAFLCCRSRLV